MKHYIFSLISIIVPIHSIAMDLPTKIIVSPNTSVQQKKLLINAINTKLNIVFKDHVICCYSVPKFFSEKDHFDLLDEVNNYYRPKIGIGIEDIRRLKKMNHLFAATLNYFAEIAWENLNKVTLNTLTIITDYTQQQPTPLLNKLLPSLKNYVMHAAYNKTKRVHFVEFFGHTKPITDIDINAQASLASSASMDETFRLWNLQTGKEICILAGKASRGYVKFNEDGSLLATATVSHKNPLTFDITIWDTTSQTNMWFIQYKKPFEALAFFEHDKKITFAILGTSTSTLYSLKKLKEPIYCGEYKQKLIITSDTNNKGYTIKKRDDYSWMAAKRAPRLYLLERAIENTSGQTSINIEKIPLYKKLLESEKDIVDTLFKSKYLNTYTLIN